MLNKNILNHDESNLETKLILFCMRWSLGLASSNVPVICQCW